MLKLISPIMPKPQQISEKQGFQDEDQPERNQLSPSLDEGAEHVFSSCSDG